MAQKYVTVLNTNDVLFGRGSGPNDHEGNIKFRELVSQRKTEYMATNHRQTKAKIARSIVDTVLTNNGRFLKKVEGEELKRLGLPNGVDAYVMADEDTIMEKAKQALRQNRDKGDAKKSPKPNSPRPVHSAIDHTALLARQGPPIVDPGAPVASPTFSRPQMGMPDQYGSPGGIVPPPPPSSDILDTQPIPFQPPGGGGGVPEPLPIQNLNVQQDANGEEFATYTTTLSDSPAPKRRDSALFMMQNANNMMGDGTKRGSLMSVGSFSTGSRRGSAMGPRMGSRRDSVKIDEVWRRDSMMGGGRAESMQMSELMESFKGMSTAGEGEFNSSSDTIGTIEGGGGNYHMSGLSQMSLVSMSSTNSLFRMQSVEEGIGRVSPMPVGGDKKPPAMHQDPRQFFRSQIGADPGKPPNDSAGMPPPQAGGDQQQPNQQMLSQQQPVAAARQSITPQDLFNPTALMASPLESNPSMNFSGDPRRLASMEELPDNMSGLGGSSASVLRALGAGSSQASSGLMNFGRTGSSMTASVFDINNMSQPATSTGANGGRILPTERRNG